jgi:hypothetical protein
LFLFLEVIFCELRNQSTVKKYKFSSSQKV